MPPPYQSPPKDLKRLRNASWGWSAAVVTVGLTVLSLSSTPDLIIPRTRTSTRAAGGSNDHRRRGQQQVPPQEGLPKLHHDSARKLTGLISSPSSATSRETASVYDEPQGQHPPPMTAATTTSASAASASSVYASPSNAAADDYPDVVAPKAGGSYAESYYSSSTGSTPAYGYATHAVKKRKQVFSQEHPPLFPLTGSTLWGFFLAILGLVIAAGGGIGGGGLLVPIYIIVMGFSPKHAIPLSNVTVFGGAIANTYLNLSKRHPLVDRPLVDWDLILVMEPLTIAGALIGAFMNKLLPELILTLALVALLGFTAYTTFQKAASLRRKETAALLEAGYRQDGSKQSELTQLVRQGETDVNDENQEEDEDEEGGVESTTVEDNSAEDGAGKVDPKLREILEYERRTPVLNLQILGALFAVVLAINLLKGGGAFRSPLGITCGSSMFWASNAAMLGWILVITALVRRYLVQRNRTKLECGYPFVEGDIQWDERATLVYPIVCCLAGFTAGMFGIGGGIVKGPLMLAMGVHPAVSSASSACMILFTSFTATTSYVVFGLLIQDYAVACLLIGFVATFAGQVGINAIMARTGNRYSYIAYSVAIVVLLSACLMTVQSLLSMAEGEKHHSGGVCGSGD